MTYGELVIPFAEVLENEFVRERHSVRSDNLINTVQYLANREREEELVLFTNKKLHMSFHLVPKSVTLNNLEQCNNYRPGS